MLFPKTIGQPCHVGLTCCVLGAHSGHPIRKLLKLEEQSSFEEFVAKTKQSLKEEIEIASPKTLVISDEHIAGFLPDVESLDSFKGLCEEFGEISAVVIYLRRQDEFRLSLFSEAVKSGNLCEFDILKPLPNFKEIPYRLNYLAILDNLSKVFGKSLVFPRIYDRKLFPDGDICADFLQCSGITMDCDQQTRSEKNLSIDGRIINKLALITALIGSSRNIYVEKIRKMIIRNSTKIFTGPGLILPREQHVAFLEQFSEQNNIIKEKYFGKVLSEELFPWNFDKHETSSLYYPDCTMPWPEFFIKFVAGTIFKKSWK